MTQLLDRLTPTELLFSERGLVACEGCGHSRRNHEAGRERCARALCDCDQFH